MKHTVTQEQVALFVSLQACSEALDEVSGRIDTHPGHTPVRSEQEIAEIERLRDEESKLTATLIELRGAWHELNPYKVQ